ncbi:MAG: alpha/beta fold hydrolase [Rhizomicrobium sp.]|jgi:dienelactone hydrolase
MKFVFVAFVYLLAGTGISRAADLAGGWTGTWTKDGDALPVAVTFAKNADAWSGSFSSDALQVLDIPLTDVTDTGGKVRWLLKGDATTSTFDGTLSDDSLNGTFAEGRSNGTFALRRGDAAPVSISSRDVTFGDGNVTLAGTLLEPQTPGPHPAILFLHGSGAEGRWANSYLAHKFAEAGFAALITDKRGVGKSTGDWKTVGFDALADDALAGLRFLRAQPDIDTARVGIYGHSQGGTFSPMVAVRDGNLAFVIASAASGMSTGDTERFSLMNSVGMSALPPAEQKDAWRYIDGIADVAYRAKPRKALDAIAAKFKSRSWYFPLPPPGDSYWTISRQIADFQSWRWWKQVHSPVMLVYGGLDAREPPTRSIKAIQSALYDGENFRIAVKFYPEADHNFVIVMPPKQGGWPAREPDYAANLIQWAKAQSGAPTSGNR